MTKSFLYIHETNECINKFSIVYMINPTFHVIKAFKGKVRKCMNNKFGNVTQTFILKIMTKKNTFVLALIMFHETIHTKARKYFIVLICVIYTIIDYSICIKYLACQSKQLSKICVDGKYLVKYFNEFMVIDGLQPKMSPLI